MEGAWTLRWGYSSAALEVARALGATDPPLALSLRGSVRAAQGDPRFLEDYRRALEVAEAQGLGVERARIWSNYAGDLGLVAGPRRSLEEYGEEFAFEVSLGLGFNVARANRVVTLVCAGDWDEALQEAAEVERDFLQSAGNASDLLMMCLVSFLPLIWRGADVDALQPLTELLRRRRAAAPPPGSVLGSVARRHRDRRARPR